MTDTEVQVVITNQDIERLDALLNSLGNSSAGILETELERASVVPPESVPTDVVTMNSIVSFTDEATGEERRIALVYPNNANASEGRISVLAPLGSALLGLKVGQVFEFPLPNGKHKRIRVTSVDFQPEAMGAYDL